MRCLLYTPPQLAADACPDDGHYKSATIRVSRKDLRKAQRQGIKQRKALHFSSHGSSQKGPPVTPSPAEQLPTKKRKISEGRTDSKPKKIDVAPKVTPAESLKKKPPKVVKSEKTALPTSSRSRHDKDEDAYIALLEKKLGISNQGKMKRRYGAAFEEDGLMGSRQFQCYSRR